MTAAQDHARTPVAWAGVAVFLSLTFILSWIPCLLLRNVWQHGTGPWITRLLSASIVYVGAMGWQPLVAALLVRRWFEGGDPQDAGLRATTRRFAFIAFGLPLLIVAVSSAVAWLTSSLFFGPAVFNTASPERHLAGAPSLATAVLLSLALVFTILVLYFQALAEELGWRGYLLVRLLRELGPTRALFAHGALWGLWYAPPLLLATPEVATGALRGVAFVVTCTLLGVLLGWLRLTSHSIMPAVIANAVLTTAAGLPFLLQNTDVGLRGSVLGVAGWGPLALTAAALLSGRCRQMLALATVAAPCSPDRSSRTPAHAPPFRLN